MFTVYALDGPRAGDEFTTEAESILYADYKGVSYAYALTDKFPGSPFLKDHKNGELTFPVKDWKKLGTYEGPELTSHQFGEKVIHNPYLGRPCWITTPYKPLGKITAKHIVSKKKKGKKVKSPGGMVFNVPSTMDASQVKFAELYGAGSSNKQSGKATFSTWLKNYSDKEYVWWGKSSTTDEVTGGSPAYAKKQGPLSATGESLFLKKYPDMIESTIYQTMQHTDGKVAYQIKWMQCGEEKSFSYQFSSEWASQADQLNELTYKVYQAQQEIKKQFMQTYGWYIHPGESNGYEQQWSIEWGTGVNATYYSRLLPVNMHYTQVELYMVEFMSQEKAKFVGPQYNLTVSNAGNSNTNAYISTCKQQEWYKYVVNSNPKNLWGNPQPW